MKKELTEQEKAKHLIVLQVSLRAVGMNLTLAQIAAVALTMDKVQEIGDKFTSEMAMEIGIQSQKQAVFVQKLMQDTIAPQKG